MRQLYYIGKVLYQTYAGLHHLQRMCFTTLWLADWALLRRQAAVLCSPDFAAGPNCLKSQPPQHESPMACSSTSCANWTVSEVVLFHWHTSGLTKGQQHLIPHCVNEYIQKKSENTVPTIIPIQLSQAACLSRHKQLCWQIGLGCISWWTPPLRMQAQKGTNLLSCHQNWLLPSVLPHDCEFADHLGHLPTCSWNVQTVRYGKSYNCCQLLPIVAGMCMSVHGC